MESILRGLGVYVILLIVFRIIGRRTLAESTNFELVVLLILSETTQQAMVDNDHSIMNALLLIITLLGASLVLSMLKARFKGLERFLNGVPLLLLEEGTLHKDRMRRSRVDASDIMEAARRMHGLERLDQVKYAVLERNGEITIIPYEK